MGKIFHLPTNGGECEKGVFRPSFLPLSSTTSPTTFHNPHPLDFEEGYKTKTGSTSSVSLTLPLALIKTEYWGRAGGEVGHACNSQQSNKVGACCTVWVQFYLHGSEMHNHWKFETLEFRVERHTE